MNNDELKEIITKISDLTSDKNLGIFMILTDEDGLIGKNQFPDWSILQYSDELDEDGDQKVKMQSIKDKDFEAWFDRTKRTIFYLLSLAEKLEEAAKTSRHLGETIIDTLKEKDIIVIVEEKESLPKQVLH